MEKAFIRYFQAHLGLYLTIIIFFLGGIIVGTVTINLLEADQIIQLTAYLDNYLKQFHLSNTDAYQAAYGIFTNTSKEIGLLWFLGLSVIGGPLIVALIFLKGFISGFTVGFIIKQKAFSGVAFSLLAILPANLIYIPALFIAAISGLSFSLNLFHGHNYSQGALWKSLVCYSSIMMLAALVIMLGGLVEIYLSPIFARAVLNYF